MFLLLWATEGPEVTDHPEKRSHGGHGGREEREEREEREDGRIQVNAGGCRPTAGNRTEGKQASTSHIENGAACACRLPSVQLRDARPTGGFVSVPPRLRG